MAARDRYGGFSEPATTPLQRLIQNACDPQNFEPNLALNLEIADLINSKKGNAPREAAVAIVSHINNRVAQISLLALNLIDICVKNCGYPFHLQISTKEFLNELVRRFPERPPFRYSRVQSKILELIEEWRSTICQTSKYKEDLGFIRDMHRLLGYKGYTFPAIRREDAAVLNPSDNLQSAEEMEAEERSAQSAKLQELIRRGGPHDLQEANRLMKVMAGYDNRHKTDYRAKAAGEVGKIQQKARLLEEMLQNYQPGQQGNDETAEELSNALASAHPKIQRMCEEESDDHEAVAKLFEINDSIHRTLERYKLVRKGDVEAASRIPRGTLGMSGAGVSRGADNELNLIDLGADGNEGVAAAPSASAGGAGGTADQGSSLENDLLGLSMNDSNPNLGGQISLGGASSQPPGLASLTFPSQQQQPQAPPPQYQPQQLPLQQPQAQKPNIPDYSALSSLSSPTPTQPQAQQQQSQSFFSPPPPQQSSFPPSQPQQAPKPAPDPFASLAASGSTPRTASPFQFQQSTKPSPTPPPPSSSSAALASLSQGGQQQQQHNGFSSAFTPPPPIQPATQASTSTAAGGGDDEWTFTSALPDQPTAHEVTVLNSSINVKWHISREGGEVIIKSGISNNLDRAVGELTFQVAVVKIITLKLEPQSSRTLGPWQSNGISQVIRLLGVDPGKGQGVKVRWKASYVVSSGGPAGERREESGEINGLGNV